MKKRLFIVNRNGVTRYVSHTKRQFMIDSRKVIKECIREDLFTTIRWVEDEEFNKCDIKSMQNIKWLQR